MEIGTPERIEAVGAVTYVPGADAKIAIPTYDDIKALDIQITVTLAGMTGNEADNQPYAPLATVRTLNLEGDGHKNLVKCKGIHLPSIHKQFYNSPATWDSPLLTAQVIKYKSRIPVGVFRHQFRDVVAKIQFGVDDDINVNGAFSMTAQVRLSAVYGKITEGYRIHYDTDDSSTLTFRAAPRGILVGETLVETLGVDDSNATIQIEHEGHNRIDNSWDGLISAESTQTQQAHLDGQLNIIHNPITVKDNTFIYVVPDTGTEFDCLFFYVEQKKPVVVRGRKVIEGSPVLLTSAAGRVAAFGVDGAAQLASGEVPRGPTYNLVATPGVGTA